MHVGTIRLASKNSSWKLCDAEIEIYFNIQTSRYFRVQFRCNAWINAFIAKISKPKKVERKFWIRREFPKSYLDRQQMSFVVGLASIHTHSRINAHVHRFFADTIVNEAHEHTRIISTQAHMHTLTHERRLHLNVCIVVALESSWQLAQTAHWTRRLECVKSQLKKHTTHPYTQLTAAHTDIASKTVFCVSPLWVYESELLAYILVIIISFFLYALFFAVVNVRFRVIPTKERSYAVEIKFQTIEKVNLVGSELLRRQERYLWNRFFSRSCSELCFICVYIIIIFCSLASFSSYGNSIFRSTSSFSTIFIDFRRELEFCVRLE